jgi:phospholipid/cholesterol/gamma-HCH transport system substrate-binding protein
MNERQLRFRIGLFVLLALGLLAGMIVLFGSLPNLFKRQNFYVIRFAEAPGVSPGTPVRLSGVRIGEVSDVRLDDETGQVFVTVQINQNVVVRKYQRPTLVAGLLGSDATIDFIPFVEEGKEPDRTPVPPGSELLGYRAANVSTLLTRASEVVPTTQEALNDMRKSMQRFEKMAPQMEATMREYEGLARDVRKILPDFAKTNEELRLTSQDVGTAARNWGRLGERLDVLVQENRDKVVKGLDNALKAIDNLNEGLTRAIDLLNEDNRRNVNAILKNVRAGSDSLESIAKNTDEIIKESRGTLRRFDGTLQRADDVLMNLQRATKPLGERSESTLRNFDESMDKLNRTLTDVRELMRVIGQSDGAVRRFLVDPSLYNHLDEAACAVARAMPRLDRILKDFETFADKLARHPEAVGIGGVVRPGSGLKDPPHR